ncbi:MAG TPA: hypothetical protein VJG90_02280 [Candidatus Nanoarchaeia archaeon]|nr:hypothetical protein [Candidatus Nanoarchaeia archaeon]
MYEIAVLTKRVEKEFYKMLNSRPTIAEKLEKLKQEPRRALEAHKLKGKWEGFWSCYLGGDIRLIVFV